MAPSDGPHLPGSVRRMLRIAERRIVRSHRSRARELGSGVIAARQPKSVTRSTRLAAARASAWPSSMAALGRARRMEPTAAAAREGQPGWQTDAGAPRGEPIPPPASAPLTAPPPADASPAMAPAAIWEQFGLTEAEYEWVFGDPRKALSHPDVVRGPSAPRPLSEEERRELRVSDLKARGGSMYGRGARIVEGPAPAPASGAERARAQPPAAPAAAQPAAAPRSHVTSHSPPQPQPPRAKPFSSPSASDAPSSGPETPASAGPADAAGTAPAPGRSASAPPLLPATPGFDAPQPEPAGTLDPHLPVRNVASAEQSPPVTEPATLSQSPRASDAPAGEVVTAATDMTVSPPGAEPRGEPRPSQATATTSEAPVGGSTNAPPRPAGPATHSPSARTPDVAAAPIRRLTLSPGDPTGAAAPPGPLDRTSARVARPDRPAASRPRLERTARPSAPPPQRPRQNAPRPARSRLARILDRVRGNAPQQLVSDRDPNSPRDRRGGVIALAQTSAAATADDTVAPSSPPGHELRARLVRASDPDFATRPSSRIETPAATEIADATLPVDDTPATSHEETAARSMTPPGAPAPSASAAAANTAAATAPGKPSSGEPLPSGPDRPARADIPVSSPPAWPAAPPRSTPATPSRVRADSPAGTVAPAARLDRAPDQQSVAPASGTAPVVPQSSTTAPTLDGAERPPVSRGPEAGPLGRGPSAKRLSRLSGRPMPAAPQSEPVDAAVQDQRPHPAGAGAPGNGGEVEVVRQTAPMKRPRGVRLARAPIVGQDAQAQRRRASRDGIAAPTHLSPSDAGAEPLTGEPSGGAPPALEPPGAEREFAPARPTAGPVTSPGDSVPVRVPAPLSPEPPSRGGQAPQRPRLARTADGPGVRSVQLGRRRVERSIRQPGGSRPATGVAEPKIVVSAGRRSPVQRALDRMRPSSPSGPPAPPTQTLPTATPSRPHPAMRPVHTPPRPLVKLSRLPTLRSMPVQTGARAQGPAMAAPTASRGDLSPATPVISPASDVVTPGPPPAPNDSSPPLTPADVLRRATPTLARAPSTSPSPPSPASQPSSPSLTRGRPIKLARAVSDAQPSGATEAAGGRVAGAGGGGGDSGGDSDAAYSEVLQRIRAEQEQLGQLIPHPF